MAASQTSCKINRNAATTLHPRLVVALALLAPLFRQTSMGHDVPNRPVPNSRDTSRHSGLRECGDAGAHVEFLAAVGVDVFPDQRGERLAVTVRQPAGPVWSRKYLLEHGRVQQNTKAIQSQAMTANRHPAINKPASQTNDWNGYTLGDLSLASWQTSAAAFFS